MKKKLLVPSKANDIPTELAVESNWSRGYTEGPNFSVYSALMSTNTNTDYTGGREWITDDRSVSSAEVIGLITDVICYHITPTESPKHETNKETTISNAVSGIHEMYWRTLSGSADLVSVLATATIDAYNGVIEFTLRIINTSGIKIPIFYVELLLDSYRYVDSDNEQIEAVSIKPDECTCVLADEYMQPSMSIIKKFHLKSSSLGFANIIVRLRYHDLERDATKEFNVIRGAIDTEIVEKNTYSAAVQCTPFHMGITAFLLPFGFGAFSAFQDTKTPGIPCEVFQAQVARLRLHFSVPIESVFTTSSIACNVTNGTLALQKTNGIKGLFGLSMACKVKNNKNYKGDLTAWSLQTIWNDEIAVYINAFIESVALTKWSGTLVVCCHDNRIKEAILADIDDFLHILSVGTLKCV